MLRLLKYVISEKLDRRVTRDRKVSDSTKVVYVKLFHLEWRLGYFRYEPERHLELMGMSLVMGTCLLFAYEKLALPKNINRVILYATWAVLCVYVALVVVATGRTCILELRRLFPSHLYYYVPASSCCTQALLYPNQGAQNLVNYLNNTHCKEGYAKDMQHSQ